MCQRSMPSADYTVQCYLSLFIAWRIRRVQKGARNEQSVWVINLLKGFIHDKTPAPKETQTIEQC